MNHLPSPLVERLTEQLASAGDTTALVATDVISNSFGAQVVHIATTQAHYLLKWSAQPLLGALTTEARGLRLLDNTGTVRVPAVVAIAEPAGDTPGYLLTEWLGDAQRRSSPDLATLGTQLAALHCTSAAHYGLNHDNYLGGTPQTNQQHDDWIAFFREQRLQPQIELAIRNGRMPTARRRHAERVIERLDQWLAGVARRPALIHGDLWGGNVLAVDATGTPAIIDPAVSYADREAEIAYTQLFGGFGPRFYAAYEAAWPLEPGYTERRDMYNVYHLLNHLNLFGESYGAQVDTALRRYS